jgi:hypothetical protein
VVIVLFLWNSNKDVVQQHELFKQGMELKEQQRVAIQEERQKRFYSIDSIKSEIITNVNGSDRVDRNIMLLNNKIDNIKLQNESAIKKLGIGNFGSAELIKYYSELPDYQYP